MSRARPGTALADDLLLGSATAQLRALRNGAISAEELLRAHFAQVDALNPAINAVIWQDRDAALEQARACDAEAASGARRGPLHGLPMTVKESFDLAGAPSTWGVPEWRDNIATRDAEAVARLRAAGAIVYGKTNVPPRLSEGQSYNDIYGTTNNPWDVTRGPGGSSGGAAAALASGMAALELGSDIGGSLRNPAHCCGVFALKPTWGVVPVAGHALPGARAETDINVAGPMARSAADLSLALDVLAGPGAMQASAWALALPDDPRERLSEFTVALKLDDPAAPVEAGYVALLEEFAAALERAGARVLRDTVPDIDSEAHFTLYMQLLGAALSAGQPEAEVAALRTQMEALGDPETTRIFAPRLEGMRLRHGDWLLLDEARRTARRAFDAFFSQADVLIVPVWCNVAFPHDQAQPRFARRFTVNGQSRAELGQVFWAGYSGVVHLPGVVGPVGMLGHMPAGYQAIAGHGRDKTALAFARAVEREIGGFNPPPMVKEAAA